MSEDFALGRTGLKEAVSRRRGQSVLSMEYLREPWSKRSYRIILIAAVVYALLRLAVQGVMLAGMWFMAPPGEKPMVPVDLQLYIDAASRLQLRGDLYPVWDRIEIYQYSPAFALAFTPFLWLPSHFWIAIVHTLLHIVAYGLLYIWWQRIFRRLGLAQASTRLAWMLPLWLVFSEFWSDLGFLNIYIIVALLATLLIEAVLHERLGWALVWLSVILQIKPHWAFAAAIPLLLGRWRFFLRLAGWAIVTYVVIVGVTALIVGPTYGLQQYARYFQLLAAMRRYFPWRGPDTPFLGYNHSITQIMVYLLGVSPTTLQLATGTKVALLLPLAVTGLRHLLRPAHLAGHVAPRLSLDWAFALYLGAFIWLDMVWELSLGMAIFTYLLATSQRRTMRALVYIVFLPYALLDIWRLLSIVVFGPRIVLPGMYILTDPTIYVPLIMVIILTFYVLLLVRLWGARGTGRTTDESTTDPQIPNPDKPEPKTTKDTKGT